MQTMSRYDANNRATNFEEESLPYPKRQNLIRTIGKWFTRYIICVFIADTYVGTKLYKKIYETILRQIKVRLLFSASISVDAAFDDDYFKRFFIK